MAHPKHSETKKMQRLPTPEQEDLERRIQDMEVKDEKSMDKLYQKIARIRAQLR